MTETQNEWPAIRIFHLAGGARAINEKNGKVKFFPEIEGRQSIKMEIGTYAEVYKKLESLGLKIYGVDFYYHVIHMSGGAPAEWRPYNRSTEGGWLIELTVQTWRDIAHAAFKKQDGFLWDMSSRIAYQLRTAAWRLREISEAYHNQVNGIIQRSAFKDGNQIMDGFTEFVNMALQGFLVDICILRDYLAEFIAIVFKVNDSGKNRITMMSQLIEPLKKFSVSEPVIQQLKEATGTGGWIKVMSSYRNLIVHSAPLAIAQEKVLAKCTELKIEGKESIPSVLYFLPKDPEIICKSRSQGSHFIDFSNMIEKFAPSGEEQKPTLDGMDYAHSVLEKMGKLARDLARKSPITAEPMVFDKSNIIGKIKFNKTV